MNSNKTAAKKEDLAGLETALASVTDPAVMRRLLRELHTPGELRALGLRWRLLKLLDGGAPQRTIAARLHVSLCKITRGARILRDRGSVTRTLIKEY